MDGLLTLQAKVTKTGAFNGAGVDVSAIDGDYTVVLRVTKLVGRARISFADSLDNFATAGVPGPSFHFTGEIGQATDNPNPIMKSFNRREWGSFRMGTTSASVRVQLDQLTGAGATIDYEAYVQYQKNSVSPSPALAEGAVATDDDGDTTKKVDSKDAMGKADHDKHDKDAAKPTATKPPSSK